MFNQLQKQIVWYYICHVVSEHNIVKDTSFINNKQKLEIHAFM